MQPHLCSSPWGGQCRACSHQHPPGRCHQTQLQAQDAAAAAAGKRMRPQQNRHFSNTDRNVAVKGRPLLQAAVCCAQHANRHQRTETAAVTSAQRSTQSKLAHAYARTTALPRHAIPSSSALPHCTHESHHAANHQPLAVVLTCMQLTPHPSRIHLMQFTGSKRMEHTAQSKHSCHCHPPDALLV